LHHLDDLPYDPREYLPHIYGKFREKQANVRVRQLLPSPGAGDLPFVTKGNLSAEISNGTTYLPELQEFGFSKA